jgi:hypothetical protein
MKPGAVCDDRPGRETTMRLAVGIMLALGAVASRSVAADPAPTPADFKLVLARFDAGPNPVDRAEMLVHGGRAYQWSPEATEILVVDPVQSRCELLDLRRKTMTRVAFRSLDAYTAALHKVIAAKAKKLVDQGGKANEIAAQMSRDLIEPRFSASFDPKADRLHLTNASVTIDALGVADPDAARLALIALSQAALIKLSALREPEAIPPFNRLVTLATLTSKYKLRPVEMTFLYRLAGPPLKARWTFRLVESLTPNELKAIQRLDGFREKAKLLPYNEYEDGHDD